MLKEFNTGAVYPTVAEEIIGDPSEIAWVNPANAVDSSDGTCASFDIDMQDNRPLLLTLDANHFRLPSDALIQGVEVEVLCAGDTSEGSCYVELAYNGEAMGNAYTLILNSEIPTWQTRGSPTDNMMGEGPLDYAVANDPTFGIWLRGTGIATGRIYRARITIYYIAETGVDEYMQTADMERMESELRSLLNDPDSGDYTTEELYSCLEGAYRETMLAARSRIARVSYPSAGGIAHVRDAPTEAGEDYVEGDLLAVVDGAATGGHVEVVEVNSDGAVLRVRAVTGLPLGTIGASAGAAYTTGTKTTTGGTGTGCTVYVDRLGAYLTAGVDVYEFPPIHEFIAIFLDGVMLHHKSLEHIYRAEHRESDATYTCWDEASPGTPTEWAFNKGSCIRVWPVPDAGGVLEAIGYAVDEDAEVERSVDRLTYLPPALMPACLDRAEARARRRRPTHPGNLTMAQMLTVDWRTACAEVGRSNKE